MPISSVTNRQQYQGDGSSAVFAFQYPLRAQADLAVFAYNSSATSPGVTTLLSLNGGGGYGYTISGNADASGVYQNGVNVIVNSAPNAETAIVIFRSSALTSSFSVPYGGAVSASALNNEVEFLYMLAQRHQDQLTRSLRLHDGLVGPFDTTLPDNIRARPGSFVAINSNANGFILTTALGGDYIANTVLIATGTSVVASLGGAQAGLFLQSAGSSAPTWAAISLGSSGGLVPSSNITGILSVAQGGTGQGTSFITNGVLFASSAVSTYSTAEGGTNQPLVGNTGAPPSFGAIDISNGSSVVGTLPSTLGGTGSPGPYTQYGLIFAPTATTFGTVPSAAAGTVLTANGSSAPTFQTPSPTNLTTGSGIVPVTNGGTNRQTMVAGAILYGSSTTQVGLGVVGINQVVLGGGSSAPATVIGYGSSAHVLTSTGDGAAPTWQPNVASVSNTVSTVSATYTQQGTDSMIIANSTNYTISLVSAAAGKELTINRGTTTNSSAVIIAGSGGITIGGVSTIQLPRSGDYLRLFFDGSNYQIGADRVSAYAHLDTLNGYGSGATKIVKFTNITSAIGNAFTVSNDATNGLSFTVNLPGVYAVGYDGTFTSGAQFGISLNASSLITNFTAYAKADQLAVTEVTAANTFGHVSWVGPLRAGDIVRPHTDGVATSAANQNNSYISFGRT